MKAGIDREQCIGCGLCTELVPKVFAMDRDHAQVIVPEVPAELEAEVRNAASECPVEAIKLD